MKILLINDTSAYHSGCIEVINFYKDYFLNHNLDITNDFNIDVSSYDIVIANGEGTMHHNANKARSILKCLTKAKKSMLVNSVWQANDLSLTKMLLDIDYISVRETKSKDEIYNQIGLETNINLDLSYFQPVDIINKKSMNIVAGNKMRVPKTKPKRPKITDVGEDGYIDIFIQSWQDIVSQLKVSKLLVTGRHHEMYAACVAECPFVVIEGNTHKNQGLFETANVNIPVLEFGCDNNTIKNAIKNIDTYKDEFTKLFTFMKSQKPPRFLDYV